MLLGLPLSARSSTEAEEDRLTLLLRELWAWSLFAPLLVGWGALKDAKDTRKEGSGVVVVVVIIAAAAAAATVRFVGNLLEML